MPSHDDSVLPPPMPERSGPQTNRAVLGVLVALLLVAVLLVLWRLVFDGNDSTAAVSNALPTPLALPTATALPLAGTVTTPTAEPTTAPVATATPVPDGFEACNGERAPDTTSTYVVDTNTTPLNQRSEPAVGADRAGTFAPGQTGLAFNGECVVNLADGYVWWKIFNGTEDVWIASDFVTRQ